MSRPESETIALIQNGIDAVRNEEYLAGLNFLSDAYAVAVEPRLAQGWSYYGLCLALVERDFERAISLCNRAIETQFLDPAHYVNLARVYVAARRRRDAIEACEQGLKMITADPDLLAFRKKLGVRAKPAVPFLSRANPINQALGRARHEEEQGDEDDATLPEVSD